MGERDVKEGGTWPGRDGAKAVTSQLAGRWKEPVRWTLPPVDAKDIRDWRAVNASGGDAEAAVLVGALKAAAKEAKPPKAPKQADAMVALAAEAELFHTPGNDGKGYATLNVPDDDDRALVLGWLVSALRPEGPMSYPLLMVNGEAGSAKSTLSRYARNLIDPNVTTMRTPPRDERDLAIAAGTPGR